MSRLQLGDIVLARVNRRKLISLWSTVLLALGLATFPKVAGARSCDEAMSRSSVEDLEKQATRLRSQVIRATIPVVRAQRQALGTEDASSQARALDEQLGLAELASSIADVRAKLATAVYLADAQQSMRSEADKAVLRRMIRKLAPSAADAAGNAVSATDEVASATQRPGVKALTSDVRAFLIRSRDAFQACVDPASIAL
jgi:hypothetical protein